MIRTLDVFLWNKKVGTLATYTEKYNEKVCFYYDTDFLKSGLDIAPLRASVNSRIPRAISHIAHIGISHIGAKKQ
ncbi:MAG: HipA N-terminal domain-containing protein [Bacteroidales bacterium]|nr:HipA N-terminal domain-containing protein [Bacteroidales bacterium]